MPGAKINGARRETAFERIVSALEDRNRTVRGSDVRVNAECPAHEDDSPSLVVSKIEGQALVWCHGGCETDEVLEALGLKKRDLFDSPRGAEYRYADGRKVHRSPEKRFWQDNAQPTAVLYRLPEVKAAVAGELLIWLPEGEKDVHALESIGEIATTAPQGADNWDKVDASPLHGGYVAVLVDKDAAGVKRARQIKTDLEGHVAELTFYQAKVGKDAADHIAAGLGWQDFEEITFEEEADDQPKRSRITWASEIKAKPVTWAWQDFGGGRIPTASLSVAAGREATGKSSFGIYLAAQISRGTLPGAFFGKPRNVFYVAIEDSWEHTLRPRLEAGGADLGRIGRFEVLDDDGEEVTLSLPYDNATLEAEVVANDVALVVIDPLMSVIGDKIDTHREREVRSALDPLAKIATKTGAIIFGIAHFNKSQGNDAASMITGSGAFKNVPRSVFGFARDVHSSERVMTQVKNSLGEDELPSIAYELKSAVVETDEGPTNVGRLEILGISDRSVAEVLGDNRRDVDELEDRHDAASFIEHYLAEHDGEAPAKDVIKAGREAGHPQKTMMNARKKVASTERRGFGKEGGSVWKLRHTSRIGPNRQNSGIYGTYDDPSQSIHPIHPIHHALRENGTNGEVTKSTPRIKSGSMEKGS